MNSTELRLQGLALQSILDNINKAAGVSLFDEIMAGRYLVNRPP